MAKTMPNIAVLDVVESLLRAAEHPDYTNITRYGRDAMPGGQWPSGVKATHLSGSQSLLWCAIPPRDARPVSAELAAEAMVCMPGRALNLLVRLLDAARPEQFVSWELCAGPGVGSPRDGESPSAVRITGRNGSVAYIRATAASGPGGASAEPKSDPCPGYEIPVEVREWQRRSAVLAGRG